MPSDGEAPRDEPRTKEDISQHLLRLIEETHRDVRAILTIQADIYNLMFFNQRPRRPAIPPNPDGVPVAPPRGTGRGAAVSKVVEDVVGGMESIAQIMSRLRKPRR